MGRAATIIDTVTDIWGDSWDVRQRRSTAHGFDILMGWPHGLDRGRGGAGGPRVIVTAALAAYLDGLRRGACRATMLPAALPIGSTALKRVRRLLGHDAQIERAAWWEARSADLGDMTVEAFAARHGVSTGAVVNARHALIGRTTRLRGWWRAPDVAGVLLSDKSCAEIADDLGISGGAARRLRLQLKRAGAVVDGAPPLAPRTRRNRGSAWPAILEAALKSGMTVPELAQQQGVADNTVRGHCRYYGIALTAARRYRFDWDAIFSHHAGQTARQIAQSIGVTRAAVYVQAGRRGVVLPPREAGRTQMRGHGMFHVRRAQWDAIFAETPLAGAPEISLRMGVALSSVYRQAKRRGVTLPGQRGGKG